MSPQEKSNPNAKQIAWLNPFEYMPVLAPELVPELESVEDEKLFRAITKLQGFAHWSVRYSMMMDLIHNSEMLVLNNLETGQGLIFADLGINIKDCWGDTTGVEGREQKVAELTMAIFRYYQGRNVEPRTMFPDEPPAEAGFYMEFGE